MDTIKIERGNTRIVAHRGLSGLEKENTNAAFVAAGNRSYYGIETDIHRTTDGRFVVFHDASMTRVAGEDIVVEENDLATLQSKILYDIDGVKDRADLRAPTLENYIKICKKYEKHCVLELKSDFTEAEIAAIIEIINGYEYLDHVTFISFVYANLVKIKAILPEQSVQFLFDDVTEGLIEKLVKNRMDVDIAYPSLTEELVAKFHDAGLVVNCWTVNDKKAAEDLVRWGVDYITTNILE